MKYSLLACAFVCLRFSVMAQVDIERDETSKKVGLRHRATKTLVVPLEYDQIQPYYWLDSVLIASKGDLKTAFDPSGRQLLPLEYRDIRLFRPESNFPRGYAMVTTAPPRQRKWGLARLGQGLALPMQYEIVAPVFDDLLVARTYNDSLLQFFDAAGTPLFKHPGLAVKHAIPPDMLVIELRDHSYRFVDKKGKSVLPAHIRNPRWTDGRTIICGPDGQVGMLHINGDTLVPCRYREILPYSRDRFQVSTADRQSGLADDRGEFLIPVGDYRVMRIKPDTNGVFVAKSSKDFNDRIYDRHGKLLFSNCRQEQAFIPREMWDRVREQFSDRYFTIKMAGSQAVGFFKLDGTMIVPPEYKYVFYCSERHPLLAVNFERPGESQERYMTYTLSGAVQLPPDYRLLRYTTAPNLMIGRRFDGEKFGFIRLDQPAQTKFEFDAVGDLLQSHFAGRIGKDYFLLDANGKRVGSKTYATLEQPNYRHNAEYAKKSAEPLIAVATRAGLPKGKWLGINAKGEALTFDALPPEPTMEELVKTEVETVVETAAPPEPTRIAPTFGSATGQGSGPEAKLENIQPPVFPGGEAAMEKFITDNLRYPEVARTNQIQGRVVVTFFVETTGERTDLQIIKDIGGGCGKEALRLVQSMPKWQPGRHNGEPTRVRYTLPVSFRLK